MSSISNIFNAIIQNSLLSSQVEETSGEDMNEVYVEPNESVVANKEFSEEEASGEDMDEAHESEGVDVAMMNLGKSIIKIILEMEVLMKKLV